MSVIVYERWHLYNGNQLVNVYSELLLLEQDVASMQGGPFVAKKVIETHQLHAIYGAAGMPVPKQPSKPIKVKKTPVSHNLIEYDSGANS